MSRPNPTRRECWKCGGPPASQDRDLCVEHEHDCPSCAQVLSHIEKDGDTAGVALMLSLAAKQRECEDLGRRFRAMQSELLALKAQKPRIEVNGPANIITHLDLVASGLKDLDANYIRKEANKTILYLNAIARGERPWWHEIKGE